MRVAAGGTQPGAEQPVSDMRGPAVADPGRGGLEHARAQLLAGHAGAAAAELHVLVTNAPADANTWNDYAAALYEVSLQEDAPRWAAAALAAADRALALEPRFPEALFNRAAILRGLGLTSAAAAAWEAFLAVEPATDWSAEARQALGNDRVVPDTERWKHSRNELLAASDRGDVPSVTALVRALPQNARTSAEYDLLNGWAKAWSAGRTSDAARPLRAAEMTGAALFAFHGETLLRDAAASARRAADNDPRSADALASAQMDYERARVLVRDRQPSQAEPLLAKADRAFAAAGSPMALVARYYRAEALFDLRNWEEALALLDSIDRELQPGHRALRGNVLVARTRIEGRNGQLSRALRHAMQAAEIFDQQAERDACARARNEVASLLSALGRPEEAWRVRRLLFADASRSGSRTLGTALYAAAKDEILLGRLEVGRSLFDLTLQQSNLPPLLRFDATLWRSFVATRTRDRDAERELAGAASEVGAIVDPALRDEALDQLRLVEAMQSEVTDPSRALRLLEECIAFREHARRPSRVAEAHLVRARVFRSAGEVERAVEDLGTALQILENQRGDVGSLLLRDSFFATAGETCQELVEIEVSRGAGERAFDFAERCRARSIVDQLAGGGTVAPARSLDEVQRSLPDDVLMLHYTALRQGTLAVAVTREDRGAVVVSAPSDILTAHAQRLQFAIQHDDSASVAEASAALYRALVAPHAARLQGKRVVIVADGPVAQVPFAILGDAGQEPLVTRAQILYAPSASAYFARRDLPRSMSRALVVGDPATGDPTLAALPGSFREAQTVARLYPGAQVLTREQASERDVLAAASGSSVVHIGAHAVMNPYDGLRSALQFAPRGTEDGKATVEEIATHPLPHAPDVVLAGCSTGVLGEGRGAIRSLALAFLAAGSRSVTATFWDVPDSRNSRFAEAFHRRLQSGDSPSLALRSTQLEWIHSPRPEDRLSSSWAAYQVIGQE